MERRDFFSVGSGQSLLPLLPEAPVRGECSLLRVSRRAMATTFEVAIPYGTPHALAAAEDALDLIDELEDQLTVYRESEVTRLNDSANLRPIAVEAKLFDLLSYSAMLTNDTAGAFDIAIGSLIKSWGFYRREGRVPTVRERKTAMASAGSRHLMLDPEARTVKFRQPGLEINLGSIGKGYALDRAAERLRANWGIESALLHGGGSSVFALGTPPHDERGWPVAVRHPHDDTRTLGTVWLNDRGFASSAATFQYFIYNDRKLGHLLDPRTGWPASGTASASVIAGTAAEADALSTAFFVLGAKLAEEYLRTRPRRSAIVLPDVGDIAVLGFANERYAPPTDRDSFLNMLEYWD